MWPIPLISYRILAFHRSLQWTANSHSLTHTWFQLIYYIGLLNGISLYSMAIQYRSIFFLFRLNNERHFCVVQISGVLSIFQVFHSGIYDFKLRIYSEFEMSEINVSSYLGFNCILQQARSYTTVWWIQRTFNRGNYVERTGTKE